MIHLTLDNTPEFFYTSCIAYARIAQLVEQGIENPCVAGSNPASGTINWLFSKEGGRTDYSQSTLTHNL